MLVAIVKNTVKGTDQVLALRSNKISPTPAGKKWQSSSDHNGRSRLNYFSEKCYVDLQWEIPAHITSHRTEFSEFPIVYMIKFIFANLWGE